MSMVLTGKPQLNRFVNRRLILDMIRREQIVSRAALARQTAIRPPTVSAVVKELLDEGLVEEVGLGATRGGRAPRMISLAKDQPKALGFELTESSILAGLCDIRGSLCAKLQEPLPGDSPDQVVEQLHEMGTTLLGDSESDWSELKGVGIAVPGHLGGKTGFVRWSRAFGWRDVPLKQLCEDRWGVSTDVVNDASAGGMATQYFHSGPDEAARNLVFLFFRFDDKEHKEVGVGAGIIINGEPYHGEFGAAGEIRTPLVSPLVRVMELGEKEIGQCMASFAAALKQSHPAAKKAMAQMSEDVANLVLQVLNLIEPGVLIIDSEEPLLRDVLAEHMQRIVEEHRLAYEQGQTKIVVSDLGEFGLVRGAIVPTLQRVFRMPQWA